MTWPDDGERVRDDAGAGAEAMLDRLQDRPTDPAVADWDAEIGQGVDAP